MSAQCENEQAIKKMDRNRLSISVTVWVIFVRRLDRNFESRSHNDFLHYLSTCKNASPEDLKRVAQNQLVIVPQRPNTSTLDYPP
jgi:hypothetical protein